MQRPSAGLWLPNASSLGTAEGVGLQGQQRALLDSIHLHYGSALCTRGEVEEGLAHLALDSGANPVALLRLFPAIAPAALLEPLLPRLPGAI